MQTGGRLEEEDPAKGFAGGNPARQVDDIVFDDPDSKREFGAADDLSSKPDKVSKGFWDMEDIAPETHEEKGKREKKEAEDAKFESYWEMPGAS